jgi:hypothetical protein
MIVARERPKVNPARMTALYRAAVAGLPLGPGNPGDDNAQCGIHIGLLDKLASATSINAPSASRRWARSARAISTEVRGDPSPITAGGLYHRVLGNASPIVNMVWTETHYTGRVHLQ